MLLYIDDSKTVQDLQDRFNKCFPYLKLAFYKGTHGQLEQYRKSNLLKPDTAVGDIKARLRSGILDIKSWDKTSKVKKELKEILGLNVQILRMYNDQWIPASYSDELTLQQQTELARTSLSKEAQ